MLMLIWLCSRRVRRQRIRRQRTAAVQRLHFALLEMQREMILAVACCLHQATQMERMLWVQSKSAAFFTDIVPGWDGVLFKQNF